ncbi:Acyl-CoA thioesterase [Amycolatopsis arida]|uniref:Acyl-CoA thioesterase n=1 Tax=Amycolatopsis arida TaxID=587909 RepID=A0A1I5QBR1_9PSEU|nr:thioesterase family protein [Amycolatopsis arida]TDX98785.1 acyl-CoA thioesterase [Amycolatopsis arida]SFP43739.1 Acyl-CoA thioesterase [Amycolatopsis arida]
MPSSQFSRDTELAVDGGSPDRYRAALSASWNAPFLPHGGLTTAVAARAMERRLGLPDQPLRSVHTVFVAPVPPGEVTVDVTILRRGRSMSQATATLRTGDGSVGLIATAVFGGNRPGFAFTDATMPEPVPPEQCTSFRDSPDSVEGIVPAPLWEQLEGHLVSGHAPWEEYEPSTSEQVYWYRFEEPPFQPDGTLDRLAFLVVSDTMLGAVSERMGTGLPVWLAPSADLTVRLFGDTHSEWILARNRAHHAGDGYVSLENELWDPRQGTLLAHATQLAVFRFPDKDVTGTVPAPD